MLATYRQAFFLREKIWNHAKENGAPLPPANKIIPSIVDAWNNLKGGVDVYSRLVANVSGRHARMKMHGTLFLRALTTMLMNDHLTQRLGIIHEECQSERKSIADKFQTCAEYKKRLNSMSSFQSYLKRLFERIDNDLKKIPLDPQVRDVPDEDHQNSNCQVEEGQNTAGDYFQKQVWQGTKNKHGKLAQQGNFMARQRLNNNVTHTESKFKTENKRNRRCCILCCTHCDLSQFHLKEKLSPHYEKKVKNT